MALQGTLETFALPDVLRLLASTKKTGQLRLTGGRGSGSIWLDGGSIIASEASGAPLADGAPEVVFELLRFKEGDFVFDADALASDGGAPRRRRGHARGRRGDARRVEVHRGGRALARAAGCRCAPSSPSDEVTLDRDRWAEIVAIGGGTTVGGLGDAPELGELPVSRTVKELIELGLVDLGEAPAGEVRRAARPPAYEAPVVRAHARSRPSSRLRAVDRARDFDHRRRARARVDEAPLLDRRRRPEPRGRQLVRERPLRSRRPW